MGITIDKNIPIPAAAGRTGRPSLYPFESMEVGDSFAVPLAGETWGFSKNDKNLTRLSNSSGIFGKKHNRKFITRTFKDEGVVRCWRIA
jgi:hypothetical protein